MELKELICEFVTAKEYEPEEMNDLLDFAQKQYIKGLISILNYRDLTKQLESLGALKPDYLQDSFIGNI